MKMNVKLAAVDHNRAAFQSAKLQQAQIFLKKQGFFRGERKTFVPRDGYYEDPSKIGTISVASTVNEQLDWFKDRLIKTWDDIFDVESTNARSGITVELKLGDKSFGRFNILELMRLKDLLSDSTLMDVYNNIPVRSDSEVWNLSDDPEYVGREIFETPLVSGVSRTTETEEVILKDPNLNPEKLPSNYVAKTTMKRKTVDTGDYTMQKFSGEWSQLKKAELLKRRSDLLAAVIVAIKEINDTECIKPEFKVDDIVNFIHNGK